MASLRIASFRGVQFWVQSDEVEVGRRLVVHEFPNRDRPFVEDLGEKHTSYHVSAYLASDSVLAEKDSLLAACRRRGVGTLVLPTEGGQMVRCKSARRTHEKDQLGFIAFKLEFVEAGTGLSATPIALLERLTLAAFDDGLLPITRAFLAEYNALRQDAWVIASAISSIQSWAETVDLTRLGTHMTTDALATIGQSVETFHRDAAGLAMDGADVVHISATTVDQSSVAGLGGALVATANTLLDEFRAGCVDEITAFDALTGLAEFGARDVMLPAYGISGRRDESNLLALNSMFRRLALGHLAVAAAEADWKDRAAAVRARATVSELFERELHLASGRTDVFAALSAIRGKAAQAVSQKLADLDPVVTVESNAVMPSIVWGYRLYNDARRATDLIARNRIAHPSFMPIEFEAESPPSSIMTATERRTALGV
jgi:prophage DNA circulation protein